MRRAVRLRAGALEATIEPDRGGGFMSFAPRVMLNLADLAATELKLTEAQSARIEAVTRRQPLYPYWHRFTATIRSRLRRRKRFPKIGFEQKSH